MRRCHMRPTLPEGARVSTDRARASTDRPRRRFRRRLSANLAAMPQVLKPSAAVSGPGRNSVRDCGRCLHGQALGSTPGSRPMGT